MDRHDEGPPAPPAYLLPPAIEINREFVAIARNPQEMQAAQSHMIQWSDEHIAEQQASLVDLEENLRVAKKNKWRTSTLTRQVNKIRRTVQYYIKVKSALEAGYCVVPNFPIDIFAIRTVKKKPKRTVRAQGWTSAHEQRSDSPPMQEGRYVDSLPTLDEWTVKKKDREGKTYDSPRFAAGGFRDVSFPFTFARAEVMELTAKATQLKVFDELGILPSRHSKGSRKGCGDPMVIGRIIQREGYNERSISFMVAWFMGKSDF